MAESPPTRSNLAEVAAEVWPNLPTIGHHIGELMPARAGRTNDARAAITPTRPGAPEISAALRPSQSADGEDVGSGAANITNLGCVSGG